MDGVKSRGENKSTASATTSGEWTKWDWSSEHQRYERRRMIDVSRGPADSGNWEYECQQTTDQVESTPRFVGSYHDYGLPDHDPPSLTSVHNLAHGGDYTTESGSSIFGGGGFGAGSAPEEEKWASATVPYESNFTSYQPSQRYYPYPYVSVGNDGYEENASSTPRYEPAQGYQSYGGTTTYPASGYVVASTDCDGYVENTSSTSRPEQLQENQASGGATTYPASGTHRASTKHRKRYPTRWSEWEWGEKFQRYYRYRERSKGEREYEYDEPRSTEPHEPDSQVVEPTPGTARDISGDLYRTLEAAEEQTEADSSEKRHQEKRGRRSNSDGDREDYHSHVSGGAGLALYPASTGYKRRFPGSTSYPTPTGYGKGLPHSISNPASAGYPDSTRPNEQRGTPSEKSGLKQQSSSSPIVQAEYIRYKDKLDSIYGVSESESTLTRRESLVEAALSKCQAARADGYFDITYELTWELPSYLKKFFPVKQPLGSILTLTGGTVDAYGSSCKDYLEKIFPDIGAGVVNCLDEMLLDSEAELNQEYPSVCMPETSNIRYLSWRYRNVPESSVSDLAAISPGTCIVNANYTAHIQVSLVLSWLCAAMRSSNHDGLSNSSVTIDGEKTGKRRTISINLVPLETVKQNGSCWHGLFPRGVIAKNFPIPLRSDGEGLEIPFADLALVSGCLGLSEYKNGLVVDGLNSILIPRKRLSKDDAFQWHFESKIREGVRIPYTLDVLDIVDMMPWTNGGHPVVPDDLLNKRCFLAWAERSTIMIGTENHFNSTTIAESHASDAPSMKYVRAYGLNFGGNVSHVAFGATVNLIPTAMPAYIQRSIGNGISDILTSESNRNSNQFVLVYDTGARIGWYLPQSCVVLHMAHYYLSEQKLDLIDDENQEISLEFTGQDGNTDGGASAASILYKNLGHKTRRRPVPNLARVPSTGSSSTPTTTIQDFSPFRSSVERIWYLLDTVGSNLKMNRAEYLKCAENAPNSIYGVDFKELLVTKSSANVDSIRYIKDFDEPWSYLTNDQSTVIFCKNFGQAIEPASEGLCYMWSKVPEKKNFLAMTGRTIRYFSKKHGSDLSKDLTWFLKKPVIQSHHQGEHSSVMHAQLLKEKASLPSKMKDKIGRTNAKQDLWHNQLIDMIGPQSCFLFSARQGKKCRNPAVDVRAERVVRPADSTESPLFTSEYALRIKLLGLENQGNGCSALGGDGTISINALGKQPAVVSLSSESSRNGNLSMLSQGPDPLDYTFLEAGDRSGEDRLPDGTQERSVSNSLSELHPRLPRTILPLPLDTSDKEMISLEVRRALMQEDDNHEGKAPNVIHESGHRGDAVQSSGC